MLATGLTCIQNRDNPDCLWNNEKAFLKDVDTLPLGPKWHHSVISLTGDKLGSEGEVITEHYDLWHRNPIECIRELLRNPTFADHLQFTPQERYKPDPEKDGSYFRVFDETWTGDWWHRLQVDIHLMVTLTRDININ